MTKVLPIFLIFRKVSNVSVAAFANSIFGLHISLFHNENNVIELGDIRKGSLQFKVGRGLAALRT